MNRRAPAVLLALFALSPLSADESDPGRRAAALVAEFRDAMYLQQEDDEALFRRFRILRADLGDMDLEGRREQFWLAQATYYMARGLQALDSIDAVLEQDDVMRRGRFKKIQKSYDELDRIVSLYEEALALTESYLAEDRDARGVRLYAETLSQLSTLKNLGFLMANGPKISPLAEEALALDPGEVKARILLASRYVYSPGIWGGDPDRGIAMLEDVAAMEGLDREDEHNIAVGIGFAHTMAERWSEALPYFRRALAVYPGNIYAAAMIRLCENGGTVVG